MKTNALPRHFGFIMVLLACLGLPLLSLHAQTFAGQSVLEKSPASLRAYVRPVRNAAAINISFENQLCGSVHIQIRDAKHMLLYDAWQPQRIYTSQFDLTTLPAGMYIIEFRTATARHTETIRIEPPTARSRIIVGEPVLADNGLVKQ